MSDGDLPDEQKQKHQPALAAIGARAAARGVDTILAGLVTGLTAWAIYSALDTDSLVTDLINPLSAAAIAVYEIVMTKLRGQTVGKMLARIRVVSVRNRALPGWWSSIVRFAVPGIASQLVQLALSPLGLTYRSLAALLFLPVFYISSALDRNRRGLHDKAAGTIVISVASNQIRDGDETLSEVR